MSLVGLEASRLHASVFGSVRTRWTQETPAVRAGRRTSAPQVRTTFIRRRSVQFLPDRPRLLRPPLYVYVRRGPFLEASQARTRVRFPSPALDQDAPIARQA